MSARVPAHWRHNQTLSALWGRSVYLRDDGWAIARVRHGRERVQDRWQIVERPDGARALPMTVFVSLALACETIDQMRPLVGAAEGGR